MHMYLHIAHNYNKNASSLLGTVFLELGTHPCSGAVPFPQPVFSSACARQDSQSFQQGLIVHENAWLKFVSGALSAAQ